jgi:hypothetical protein
MYLIVWLVLEYGMTVLRYWIRTSAYWIGVAELRKEVAQVFRNILPLQSDFKDCFEEMNKMYTE